MKKSSKSKVKLSPKKNLKISQFFFRDKTNVTINKNVNPDSEDEFMDLSNKYKAKRAPDAGMNSSETQNKRKASEDTVDSEQPKKINRFTDLIFNNDGLKNNKSETCDPNGTLDITNCTILNEKSKSSCSSDKICSLLGGSSEQTNSPKKSHQSKHSAALNKDIMDNRLKSPVKTQLQFSTKEDLSNMTTILDMDFDTWEDEIIDMKETFTLDLTKPTHCKIININHIPGKVELSVMSTKSDKKGICILEGFWIDTTLAVGDTIYITCEKLNGNWVVNNDHGLIIYEPDTLISATAVVGSLWCRRRSILSERFRGFDSTNKYMLVGSLVHSTFQYVLKNNLSNTKHIEDAAKNFIKKNRIMMMLYECNITLQWLEDEVLKYVPKIQEFISVYTQNTNNSKLVKGKDDWKGTINSINDIEENMWCPELGIKGKIDVTVQANNQVIPLELKTGKTSVSIEHRGQIVLYLMMMKNIGYDIISGLLLYLKEGVMREIQSTQKEERDLIRLRNELVYFLTQSARVTDKDKIVPPILPEPINHNSCKTCPNSTICTLYADFSGEDLSSKKVLKEIQHATLMYLSKSHIDYFMKWTSLLILESESNICTNDTKEIYLTTPEQREENGKCISNLKIGKVEELNEVYCEHFFEKVKDMSKSFLVSCIFEGSYVVISTNKRHAVASGFVTNISTNSISVSLERNLNNKYRDNVFCIDSYNSGMSQTYNFNSLALLIESTDRAEALRKIIIDKEPPTFKATLPKIIGTKGKSILKRLNRVQQRAVLKALTANEYFLIKGMPGTGKTATIVALIQLLYELNRTILITSHTNSAVDNVCLKLLEYDIKFLRLGSESKIHKDLLPYSEHNLTKHCTSPADYDAVYNGAQILAVTCMASGHPVLTKRTLDICIIDESTQVLQTSVIRPISSCKTFILIGDPDQLPAVIRSRKARDLGMSESLFERLCTENAAMALNINYRMNSKITSFANTLTYNGELQVGSENIATATLNFPNKDFLLKTYGKESWIIKALDDTLDNSVQFIDTGPVWNLTNEVEWKVHKTFVRYNSQNDKNSKVNIYEAAVIFKIVDALVKGGVEPKNIGVIASYRHQVAQISSILNFDNIDVNTVDQFQGKDKSVIVYSCGNSKDTSVFKNPSSDDILTDKRRLNVAITRSKHKLIIVGDITTLMVYPTFNKLLSLENNIMKLTECKDFLWENILKLNSLNAT